MKKIWLSLMLVLLMASTALAQININTATAQELESLSGIGPAKAQAIVAFREAQGNFKTVDDLANVPGIGDKILEKIKTDITVGSAAPAGKPSK